MSFILNQTRLISVIIGLSLFYTATVDARKRSHKRKKGFNKTYGGANINIPKPKLSKGKYTGIGTLIIGKTFVLKGDIMVGTKTIKHRRYRNIKPGKSRKAVTGHYGWLNFELFNWEWEFAGKSSKLKVKDGRLFFTPVEKGKQIEFKGAFTIDFLKDTITSGKNMVISVLDYPFTSFKTNPGEYWLLYLSGGKPPISWARIQYFDGGKFGFCIAQPKTQNRTHALKFVQNGFKHFTSNCLPKKKETEKK